MKIATWNVNSIRARIDNIKKYNHADDYFLKLIHRKKHADWYLTAPDALKHDLASKLYVPSLSVEVSVDIKLE